ncbi:MAG: molecular chaperone TorD family protein [Coriobacteriaceae bacterium]|nr:molecular chaperone TorD family protein [Coriobacteriaceae bacterium]
MADTKANASSAEAADETTAEFTRINNQRATTYALLARLYRSELDADFLQQLRSMRFPANAGNEDATKGYYLIAKYLSNVWDKSLEELAVDYNHTFIGNGVDAYSAAYPFESVYTSPKRLLMQDARDEVLAIYRSEGLKKQESWKEGEDHIAPELEFEQHLCNRVSEALSAGDEGKAAGYLITQRNFLDDHLRTWVPLMTKDMKRFAQTNLYLGLAYLTDGFLQLEHDFLRHAVTDEDDETGGGQ